MSLWKSDQPMSLAELEQWDATVATMEAADRTAGITNQGTVNARRAVETAAAKKGRRS
jgi:hypothetical protein